MPRIGEIIKCGMCGSDTEATGRNQRYCPLHGRENRLRWFRWNNPSRKIRAIIAERRAGEKPIQTAIENQPPERRWP